MFFYFFYKLGQIIVRILSLNNAYRLSQQIAMIRYSFSIRDKRIVAENLKTVLEAKGEIISEEKIEKLSREVYENFGKYLVEFFKFSKIDKDFINKKVKIVGNIDIFNQLLNENKGLIAVSAHLGNWELGAAIVNALGYPSNSITLPHTSRIVSNFFDGLRIALGVRVIPIGMAIKRCFKALKDNEVVCFLGDKDFSGNGIKINFMGKDVLIPRGPAVISLKTEAPIILIFLIREKDNNFKIIIEEAIHPAEFQDEESSVRLLTQKYVRILEKYIKDYPTQWLMFRKVWNS